MKRILAYVRTCGRSLTEQLANHHYDVIVAVAGETIAYLETDIPIVLVSDTNFQQLMDYYPYYSHLLKRSRRELLTIDTLAFKKVHSCILTSDWAAQSAIVDYHVDANHVHVVPFGVNFDDPPSVEISHNRKLSNSCKLLFTALEWERKGGDIAFETLLKLEELGIEVELVICGCVPPGYISHPRLRVIPHLDKNDLLQQQEMEQLFITADFLLLPTRADCAPNVMREANAFGLPVITTNTGGIASMITNGENGFMLPLEARGPEYAELIAEHLP